MAKKILKEETGAQKRACVANITDYCCPMFRQYLQTRMVELPDFLKNYLDKGASKRLFNIIANNQNGSDKFIDFLRINLYNDFFIRRNNLISRYLKGISRIVCGDCGYYSFSPSDMKGGQITTMRKILMVMDDMSVEELDSLGLDADFNGMNYQQFVEFFSEKMRQHREATDRELQTIQVTGTSEYDIIRVPDELTPYNLGYVATPTEQGRQFLSALHRYVNWCICEPGTAGVQEYQQYTQCGGAFYICLKHGFRQVQPTDENGPVPPNALDDYGLSMIAVLVGSDGYPENITTRWNHDYEGENNKMLHTAPQLQRVLNVDYKKIFKPRSPEQLHQLHLDEALNRSLMKKKNGKRMLSEAQFMKLVEVATIQTLKQILKEDGEDEMTEVENNIRRYCNPQIRQYLNTPLGELPQNIQNSFSQAAGDFNTMLQEGGHDLMSFFKHYMFSQLHIDENGTMARMLPGITRLLCGECGFYRFDGSVDLTKAGEFLEALKNAARREGLQEFDADLNGMTCEEVINAISRTATRSNDDFDFDSFINNAREQL